MTTTQAIQQVREILLRRYPDYDRLPAGERVLLAASVLANDIEVAEVGANRGKWVEAILAGIGLGPGYPWCAAAIDFCCDVAQVQAGPQSGRGAVRNWVDWARRQSRVRTEPDRGRLCYWLRPNGTGHIGIVASVLGDKVVSYEGNTGPDDRGSQRDGDGMYCRKRDRLIWGGYITLGSLK